MDWLEIIEPLEKKKLKKRRASDYRERKQSLHTTTRGSGKVRKLVSGKKKIR